MYAVELPDGLLQLVSVEEVRQKHGGEHFQTGRGDTINNGIDFQG